MHLVKWIRKNERKIMAWVVILIMISFVGGYGFQQLMENLGRGGSRQVIATYSDGQKIRAIDYQNAQNDLEILRMLMADRMLGALSQVYGDLGPSLLQLILFPDSRSSGELRLQLIQLAERGQLPLNTDQIDQFFAPHQHRPEFLWILLKAEAHQVGYVVTETEAANYLNQMVSGMTQNQIKASSLISQIMKSTNNSESQIIRIFGELIGIMNYADLILGNYAVTSDEIRVSIARTMERLTAEFILLDSDRLIEEQPEPTAEQIEKQFQQFSSLLPGDFADENPYGFGYKIPKRIRLEYFLVNLGDVQKQIEKPSSEELEGYYSRNLSRYQRSEPIDPNNPDAGTRTLTRPFAQVMHQIRQDIEKQKTEDLAIMILNEARQLTETGFDTIEYGTATALQMQQAAGDYVAAAEELKQKYQVSIYTGKTGWLSPADIRTDLFLRRISIPTSAETSVRLSDVLLAIPPDGKPSSQPGLPAIRIWENISPLSSGLLSEDNQYITLRAMIRVIGIQEPLVPQDLTYTFDNHGVTLSKPDEDSVFSIQEKVAEDLKSIQAMEAADKQASALAALVEKEGWETGLESFNQTYYSHVDPNNPASAKPEVRTISKQLVSSQSQIEALRQRMRSSSGSADTMMRYLNALFIRKMAEMMDPQQQTTGPIARILTMEQARQVCVVKELTKEPATEKDYQDNKNRVALQQVMLSKMDLGLIHFRPDNIAGRMALTYKEIQEQPEPVQEEYQEE